MKYLWAAVPFITLWLLYFIPYYFELFVRNSWYEIPLVLTMFGILLASIFIAVEKIFKDKYLH